MPPVSLKAPNPLDCLLLQGRRYEWVLCVGGSLGARTAALLLALHLLRSKMLVFFLVPRTCRTHSLGNHGFLGSASILFADILESTDQEG